MIKTNRFPMPALRSNRDNFSLAYDRASSVRTISKDGRLHVSVSNLSKATVSPYHGTEVPQWKTLGLDPDRTYQFLRDPDELKKAAASFNNLPLLSAHSPVTAANHAPDLVIGATGSDAVFEAPYLKNSLVIWAKDAIEAIESGEQREISCGYYWTPVMEPGVFNGERYDGRMTQLTGSHVALVSEGRAGPDCLVADSKQELQMHKLSRKAALTQGALLIHLAPLMAADAKPDLAPFLVGVTAKNFKASRAAILAGVRRATAGKLAADAVLDLDAVGRMIETLEGVPTEEDDVSPFVPAARTGKPDPAAADADGPLSEEEEALYQALAKRRTAALGQSADEETPDEKAGREAKIRSDAAHKRERDAELAEHAENLAKSDRQDDPNSAAAMDSRRRAATAQQNFATRYPEAASIGQDTFGVQPSPESVRAMDRKAAPTQAKARAFHDRYPDAAKVQKL